MFTFFVLLCDKKHFYRLNYEIINLISKLFFKVITIILERWLFFLSEKLIFLHENVL